MTDWEDVLSRIKARYDKFSTEEQVTLRNIVKEIADYGYSPTYENIWMTDFKEIPVDKYTFLTDPYYLGQTNNNGESIYPAWMNTMLELEKAGNQYTEIVFTGATRTGKTSTAVSDAAYMFYWLMCLRDPQSYFGLKSITNISIFFFNITQTLARGVAFKEFNSLMANSPWFLKHGHMNDSEAVPTYIPDGGLITIEYGSDASHALGKATFCLVGDTKILTDRGIRRIASCTGPCRVCQWSGTGMMYSDARVVLTKYVKDTLKLEFNNYTYIEGTPDHKIQLYDGSYEELQNITYESKILDPSYPGPIYLSNKVRCHYEHEIPVFDVVNAEPYHNFIVVNGPSQLVAHNCVVFDECNFAAAGIKDINKAKVRMKAKYDTLVARVTGTFVKHGEVFGRLYVISSKNSDSDFMEEYIATQKEAGNEHMYVFDKPQWEVWPASKYTSDKKFKLALGGKHLRSFVVPDDQTDPQSLADIEAQGFKILDVPEDNKTRFLADIDIALRDIAGISVPGTFSFITQDVLDKCITNTRRNPFYTDIISIGTKDSLSIEEFYHMEATPDVVRKAPMYIHLDLSLTTDRTGISGVSIVGRKDIADETGKKISLPVYAHVFTVAIQAPRGDKIAYDKILRFICWLRRQHFNISRISRDQFQSEYLGQLLEAQGFPCDKISLDRTPDGYIAGRAILIEDRVEMLHNELLERELTHLQRDASTGKVDHVEGESKDASDSFIGAMWNAMLNTQVLPTTPKSVVSAISAVNTPKSNTLNNSKYNMFGNIRKF